MLKVSEENKIRRKKEKDMGVNASCAADVTNAACLNWIINRLVRVKAQGRGRKKNCASQGKIFQTRWVIIFPCPHFKPTIIHLCLPTLFPNSYLLPKEKDIHFFILKCSLLCRIR